MRHAIQKLFKKRGYILNFGLKKPIKKPEKEEINEKSQKLTKEELRNMRHFALETHYYALSNFVLSVLDCCVFIWH